MPLRNPCKKQAAVWKIKFSHCCFFFLPVIFAIRKNGIAHLRWVALRYSTCGLRYSGSLRDCVPCVESHWRCQFFCATPIDWREIRSASQAQKAAIKLRQRSSATFKSASQAQKSVDQGTTTECREIRSASQARDGGMPRFLR